MTDRTSIETCKRFFGLTDEDEAKIEGIEGAHFLLNMWQKFGQHMYENAYNVLRQEWWHAYVAPGHFDAPPGFWLTLPDDALLLDYGCGTAEIDRKLWIERGGRTVLIDISVTVRNYLRHKYQAQREAGTVEVCGRYDARPDQFDAIVCTDLFEHVPQPMLLLKELWKTLKTGGQMLTNFSISYPHPGHLRASIEQHPEWWQYLKKHSTILLEDGYTWLIKVQ